MMTSRMAFSCTCQPKRNDANPQRVTAPIKVSEVGCKKSLASGSSWKMRVRMNVVLGEISGRTAKEVSPTRPRVTLFTAVWSTVNPSLGATSCFC